MNAIPRLGLLAVLSLSAIAGAAPLDRALPRQMAARKLAGVERGVRALAAAGKRPVGVFDIDDTLLQSGPNTQQALRLAPEPGAVAYVHALAKAGATIVYLTGRWADEKSKTLRALEAAGLPLGANTHLLLNPSRKVPTLAWKRSATLQVKKLGTTVALFENELENARMFREEFPHSAVFRLATSSHNPDPGGAGKIFVIDDFAAL